MNKATECLIHSAQDQIYEKNELLIKTKEFQIAMDRYHASFMYKKIGLLVSIMVISLQFITALQFYQMNVPIEPLSLIIPFICAYILTDFINGLVHLFMDNNTHYHAIFGPLIATFHLHHVTPRYTDKHPLKVYFDETGSKIWLLFYLMILVIMQHTTTLPVGINFGLVCFGILSSVAEVSHYWCHNANNQHGLITLLQNYGVLLSKKHHRIHHTNDNMHYAFLNGITDPLINLIAKYFYDGYKSNSDLHAKAYQKPKADNRHSRSSVLACKNGSSL